VPVVSLSINSYPIRNIESYYKDARYATVVCLPVLLTFLLTDRLGDTALAFPELSEDPDALQQIPLPPNNESDRKDEIRDLAFIDSFEGKCPQTPQLLILLGADDRLKSFKFRDAEALLKKHPVLEKALLYSWQNKSFKRIRQLGASSVNALLSGSSVWPLNLH
jgi:hypothetical protein